MQNRFKGHIGSTYHESEPWWPETTKSPKNVYRTLPTSNFVLTIQNKNAQISGWFIEPGFFAT